MFSTQSRLNNSTFFSVTFHGAAFGLYLMLKVTQVENTSILTQVEFLDARPSPAPAAAPAAKPVRSIKDFLKMALPSLSKSPQMEETRFQEMPAEKEQEMLPFASTPKLVSKTDHLVRQASLDGPILGRSQGSAVAFQEIASKDTNQQVTELAMVGEPSISLEVVGQTAVRRSRSPAISIDSRSSRPRRGALANISVPVTRTQSRAPSGLAQGSSLGTLNEGAPVRRRSFLPSSSRRGYGKGGGGISLGRGPIGRPSAPAMPVEKTAKSVSKTPQKISTLNRSGNAVEIVGPLAKRKVLSHSVPSYPQWAKDKGVEAEVVIRFFVSADGRVRDNLFLERTSGYKDLDQQSMKALKSWIFAPLPKGDLQADQWGIITFRFRLK